MSSDCFWTVSVKRRVSKLTYQTKDPSTRNFHVAHFSKSRTEIFPEGKLPITRLASQSNSPVPVRSIRTAQMLENRMIYFRQSSTFCCPQGLIVFLVVLQISHSSFKPNMEFSITAITFLLNLSILTNSCSCYYFNF